MSIGRQFPTGSTRGGNAERSGIWITGSRPLVIVGGGPAGITAAVEAAGAGLRCTLVDEAPRLGGQVYRQGPNRFRIPNARAGDKDYLRGEELRSELAALGDRIEVLSGISVLGVWGSRELLWASSEASGIIRSPSGSPRRSSRKQSRPSRARFEGRCASLATTR